MTDSRSIFSAGLSAGWGPDTVATPEGDGESDPAEPLTPGEVESSVEGLQTPRGGAPAAYESDTPSGVSEMVDVIDEISRGKLMP
jgi:hypothetical protein